MMLSQSYCPIIGETHCKCLAKRNRISSLKVDLKGALRKLFTDHAVYTVFVMKGIVDGTKDVPVFLSRLLLNQKDIGDQLKPIIGDSAGNALSNLLTDHIKFAGDVITAASKKSPDVILDMKINDLFANSDQVAELISSLNPEKLPFDVVQIMFGTHNQYVIDMTLARISGRFTDEQQLYDSYYNEIIQMSDAIFNAL